jgi:hypothetical protein
MFILVLVGFFCTIAAATVPARVPLWIPVLLVYIVLLLQVLPIK